ncbi:MAG: methyltransferase domain-containing protein [Acidobacteria bacterium]|nr:methyltransferase domain-containing protein [Acidobacteriota bacterium]
MPSPALFFETINAYQRTASLKAAIELEVFTAIGEGNATAAELARRCQTSERGMRILCDYLVVIGFLTKEGNRYGLTTDSAFFLDRRSPAYLGSSIKFLLSPTLTEGYKDVAAIVRKGGTVISEKGTMEPEHPVWVEFARSVAPVTTLPSQAMAELLGARSAGKWKVLDIAAGHGLFGITLAKHNPNAAIVALDWPNVLEVAKENAQKAGLDHRYSTIPGSAFEADFGSGYDLALLTNFLHHFDIATCEKLLRKVHAALAPGGRAVTLEFVPNEDRVSPPPAATCSMMMLGTTAQGDAYTFSEFDRMFRSAGFSRSELHPLPPSFQQVIVSHK